MTKEFEFVRLPYQSTTPLSETMLADWESKRGFSLPQDYRSFLLKTNGGTVRPNTFDLILPPCPIAEKAHAVVRFFDWEEMREASQEEVEPELRNLPPGYLAIAITSTELMLLLSIKADDLGAICAWVSDFGNVWGEGENNVLVPVAEHFTAFLKLLRQDSQGETYQGYWSNHDRKGMTAERMLLP